MDNFDIDDLIEFASYCRSWYNSDVNAFYVSYSCISDDLE